MSLHELYKAITTYTMPEFVKQASQNDIFGDDLAPHQFADMVHRQYPLHTAAATCLSAVAVHEKRASVPSYVVQRIDKAAEFFGITGHVAALRQAVTDRTTYDITKEADDAFAVVAGTGDAKERHWPMRNAKEVQAAATALIQHRHAMPYAQRNTVATRILDSAAKFGADLRTVQPALEKMAGNGICASNHAAALIRSRIRALANAKAEPLRQELEKLAQICEQTPHALTSYDYLVKLAQIIDGIDTEYGIRRTEQLPYPEDVLFEITASDTATISQELIGNALTGRYYKAADLQHVPMQDFVDGLGEDFADAVTTTGASVDLQKLAAIVPTLPRGDAEIFDQIVSAARVTPCTLKTASVGVAIPARAQVTLAARHVSRPGSLWAAVRSS